MSTRYGWAPYVPVAQRRANAKRELAKRQKKSGQIATPVVLSGKNIAMTFWGKAWCENLEAYSDYENRLPRGRTYVRNGSVVDLQIAHGEVKAMVCGRELYTIQIKVKPLRDNLWKSIQSECAGQIDSVLELLQGRLSSGVMQIVTRQKRGLFPTPQEIGMTCSCPDWAGLCKHVAATLYGIGARLDEKPDLLFLLRGVDAADLVNQISAAQTVTQRAPAEGAPALSDADLSQVFGIELEGAAAPDATLPHASLSPDRSGKKRTVKGKAGRSRKKAPGLP